MVQYAPAQSVNWIVRRCIYPRVLAAQSLRVALTRMEGAARTGHVAIIMTGPDHWAFDLAGRLFRPSPKRTKLPTVADLAVQDRPRPDWRTTRISFLPALTKSLRISSSGAVSYAFQSGSRPLLRCA